MLSPHSITSSARASTLGETVRPSALAVLRLITNPYLVGCCSGRLAGLAPSRVTVAARYATAMHVSSAAAVQRFEIGTVAQQAAIECEQANGISRRRPMTYSQLDDQRAMRDQEGIGQDDQSSVALERDCGDRRFDIGNICDLGLHQIDGERGRPRLE
jgi:hypothetical protein